MVFTDVITKWFSWYVLYKLLLIKIWSLYYLNKKNKIVKISASYFVGVLIHQVFELSLTQNNLPFGLIAWVIIAIGIKYSLFYNEPVSPR